MIYFDIFGLSFKHELNVLYLIQNILINNC